MGILTFINDFINLLIIMINSNLHVKIQVIYCIIINNYSFMSYYYLIYVITDLY
jgi:hypothetical protein